MTDITKEIENMDELVNRFLRWPLPKDVCSDLCVTNPNYTHERSGTNLLTFTQAKQMLEFVLQDSATKFYQRGREENAELIYLYKKLYDDAMFILQGSVADPMQQEKDLRARDETFKKIFDLENLAKEKLAELGVKND